MANLNNKTYLLKTLTSHHFVIDDCIILNSNLHKFICLLIPFEMMHHKSYLIVLKLWPPPPSSSHHLPPHSTNLFKGQFQVQLLLSHKVSIILNIVSKTVTKWRDLKLSFWSLCIYIKIYGGYQFRFGFF